MLAPDEQMWLDFGKLIHDQVPDKDGRTLPPDLASGTYRIRDLSDGAAGGLYEGKVTLDRTYGHAAYGCSICCGYEDVFMEFNPLAVAVSGYEDQSVEAGDSCGGGTQNITGDFPTWWTGNTAIATASGHQINGVAAGTTPHYAKSVEMYWGQEGVLPKLPANPTDSDRHRRWRNSAALATFTGTGACTASGPSGSTFSNWKFTDASNNTVTGNGSSSSWSGVMVASGTVSVSVTSGDASAVPTA